MRLVVLASIASSLGYWKSLTWLDPAVCVLKSVLRTRAQNVYKYTWVIALIHHRNMFLIVLISI